MVSKSEIDSCNVLLSQIKESLSGIVNTTEISDRLSQLNVAIEFLSGRFARDEIVFLGNTIFGELKNALASLQGGLQRYTQLKGNHPSAFFSETKVFIDTFSKYSASIPFFRLEEGVGILEAHNLFVEQTKNTILKYEEKMSELSSKLNKLENLSAEIEQKVDGSVTTISRSQESQSGQFKQAEEGRSATFSNSLKQYDSEFKKELDEIKAKHKEHDSQLVEMLDSTKTTCNEKLEEITTILAITANTSLSGVSGCYADKCKNSASRLFFWALALMVLGAMVLVAFFWRSFSAETVTLGIVAFRLSFAIPLFLPAFYCACEAKRMGDKEQFYRDFSIKVATIPPYLNGVNGKSLDGSGRLLRTEEEKLDLLHHLITESKFKSSKESVLIPKDVIDLITQLSKLPLNK